MSDEHPDVVPGSAFDIAVTQMQPDGKWETTHVSAAVGVLSMDGDGRLTFTPIGDGYLPLTSDTQGDHQHGMQACTNDGQVVGLSEMFERYPQTVWRRPYTVANINNAFNIMIGYPMEFGGAHAHTIPLGGSGTPIDITPKTFGVNHFVYLGP